MTKSEDKDSSKQIEQIHLKTAEVMNLSMNG